MSSKFSLLSNLMDLWYISSIIHLYIIILSSFSTEFWMRLQLTRPGKVSSRVFEFKNTGIHNTNNSLYTTVCFKLTMLHLGIQLLCVCLVFGKSNVLWIIFVMNIFLSAYQLLTKAAKIGKQLVPDLHYSLLIMCASNFWGTQYTRSAWISTYVLTTYVANFDWVN